MKKLTLLLLLLVAMPCLAKKSANSAYPKFSWDKAPLCAHLSKEGENFTEAEAKFMAETYPLIVLEKNHGDFRKIGADVETLNAAKMIKKYNPDCKVLIYLNVKIDYLDMWSTGSILNKKGKEDWVLKDKNGIFVPTTSNKSYYRLIYDYRAKGVTEYWSSLVRKWVSHDEIDGIFADAMRGFFNNSQQIMKHTGREGYYELCGNVAKMFKGLKKEFANKKIIIGNILIGGFPYFPDGGVSVAKKYAHGGMIEHFAAFKTNTAKYISAEIDVIKNMSKAGLITMVKGWPRYTFIMKEPYKIPQDEMEKILREDLGFPLACFLMGAGEQSYFCYSWGYRHNHGGMLTYDECDRPLGKPLGDYTRKGWVYTRDFENVKITVNLETKQYKYNWK